MLNFCHDILIVQSSVVHLFRIWRASKTSLEIRISASLPHFPVTNLETRASHLEPGFFFHYWFGAELFKRLNSGSLRKVLAVGLLSQNLDLIRIIFIFMRRRSSIRISYFREMSAHIFYRILDYFCNSMFFSDWMHFYMLYDKDEK